MKTARIEIDLPPAAEPWRLTATALEQGEVASIRSTWTSPQAEPAPPQAWRHAGRQEEPLELAGVAGASSSPTASKLPGTSSGGRCGWRMPGTRPRSGRSWSTAADARSGLQALMPLQCDGPESLLISGRGAESWDVLVQKRFKNDGPTAFRPGVGDADLEMAVKPVGPTGEALPEAGEGTTLIRADPFCMLRPRGDSTAPALLIGYLSQTGHLARILLQFADEEEGGTRLEQLTAECELDGVEVKPGEQRASQWLLIAAGETNRLIAEFADRVGIFHGVVPAPSPPAVWCSFSAYGESYSEALFDQDLADLAARRVPMDFFLIDGGWERSRGDWEPDPERWPGGMKAAAARIADLGYGPALWTAPYTVHPESPLAKEHPDWMATTADGERYDYMNGYVLDTTAPGACDHLEQLYRTLTRDWGYRYHKFDFMRGIFNNPGIRFRDPSATRLDAYRRGLEAIRRGAGPDAYLCVCGGHFGGSLGLADAQRSGSDVRGWWEVMKPRIKQNLLRTWMHRLWHVDPDAMLLRRREEPLVEGAMGSYTLGRLSDDEARTVVLNQYLGGQLICLGEAFRHLDEDRRSLLRHAIPSIGSPAVPLDPLEPVAPSQLVTRVTPRCRSLEPWSTLALINWSDAPQRMQASLSGQAVRGLKADRFLVTEFFTDTAIGVAGAGESIDLGLVAPHASRLLRIAPGGATGPCWPAPISASRAVGWRSSSGAPGKGRPPAGWPPTGTTPAASGSPFRGRAAVPSLQPWCRRAGAGSGWGCKAFNLDPALARLPLEPPVGPGSARIPGPNWPVVPGHFGRSP